MAIDLIPPKMYIRVIYGDFPIFHKSTWDMAKSSVSLLGFSHGMAYHGLTKAINGTQGCFWRPSSASASLRSCGLEVIFLGKSAGTSPFFFRFQCRNPSGNHYEHVFFHITNGYFIGNIPNIFRQTHVCVCLCSMAFQRDDGMMTPTAGASNRGALRGALRTLAGVLQRHAARETKRATLCHIHIMSHLSLVQKRRKVRNPSKGFKFPVYPLVI